MEVNGTLLIQLALFLSLLGFLSNFLFSPILKLFEERERRIDGAKQEAGLLSKKAQEKLEEVESRIHAAQREAKQTLFALQAEGARFHREILEAARAETQKRLRESQEDLAQQITRLRGELLDIESDLTAQIVQRLSGESPMISRLEPSHA